MSSLVAVAGGTGNLGRTIVEAIIADGKFQVVILAREANAEKEKQIGAKILPVNYSDVDGLTKVLEDNNIETVISTLNTMGATEPELNLIAAADRAKSTKRFVPSIWGVKYTQEISDSFPIAKAKLAVTAALEKTSLEYTSWFIGYFADYYVAPHLPSHMTILRVVIDMANNAAAIPGSGDVPVAFTYTVDLAKFVSASLSLPKWQPETYLVGDKLTWNQLLALAEAVKGTKFSVTYDSVDSLKEGKVSELPSHPAMYGFFPKEQLQGILATFGLMFEAGLFNLEDSSIVQDFPDIKLRTMKELLTEAWEGKE
ncbi:NmrA domain-containing protein [Fusarium sp. LHS14.1]|nr:NmrA domain-containing protein [Fusarium sp. LHS14.1]